VTYQQKFEELRIIFAQKCDNYMRAEKQLSSLMGWGDSAELKEFFYKKKEFDTARSKYHAFLTHARRCRILPDDQFK